MQRSPTQIERARKTQHQTRSKKETKTTRVFQKKNSRRMDLKITPKLQIVQRSENGSFLHLNAGRNRHPEVDQKIYTRQEYNPSDSLPRHTLS